MGKISIGTIQEYDPHTMSAEIISVDGTEQYLNAAIMMSSYNPENGGGSFTPPVVGAPCVYTVESGEVIILGYYAPPNAEGPKVKPSTQDLIGDQYETPGYGRTYMNRSSNDLPNKTIMGGGFSHTTSGGNSFMFLDKMTSFSLSSVFYFVMNALNEFIDIMCSNLRLRTPIADVSVSTDAKSGDSNPGQVNIVVRQTNAERESGATPAINLVLGKDTGSGVINLKINGQPFLKVDLERNVTFDFKTMTMKGQVYDASGVTDDYVLP